MSVTDTLRECHRLRKLLKALQEEIDRGPRVLKIQQTRLEQERQAHHDHHESITKLKLKQREDEGTLKQTDTRLAKLEEQLTGITVPKEYEAKQSEIRQAREKRGQLEDSILTTMGELEEKTAAIPAVEKKWADAQAEFAQQQEDAKARLERIRAEQADATAALAKAETGLPEKLRVNYDHMVKGMGVDAFAAVKDKVCQGCRTGVGQQRLLELQGGLSTQCARCGRMLYPAE